MFYDIFLIVLQFIISGIVAITAHKRLSTLLVRKL